MRHAASALVLLGSVLSMIGCDGGSDDGSTDDATPQNPQIIEFTSAMEAVPRGETVELRWKVANAKTVTIFSSTEILVTTSEPEGTVSTLAIRNRSTFTLRATGSGPAVGQTIEVDAIWPEPRIDLFTAEPQQTIQQTFTTLRWQTENAESVSVLANGNPVPNSTFTGASAKAFSLFVTVQTATTTFTLEAKNPTHTIEKEVVVYAVPPPMFRAYRVTPRTFIGTATTATVTWDAVGFDRVELLASFFPVSSFPGTLSGTFSMAVEQTTEFALVGYVDGLQYTQTYSVVARAARELEPNDDPTFPQYISYEGGAEGTISSTNDVDYYIIDIYEVGDLHVWVRGADGGCPTDTQIELFDAFRGAGPELIGSDQDDGIPTGRGGACAELSPERDEFVRLLAGTYLLAVRGERGETGPYVLFTESVRR